MISSATFGGSWVGGGAAFVLQVPTYAKNQLTLASPKTALQYYACRIAGQLKCVTMEVSVATGGVVQLKAVEAWYDSSAVVVTNPASPYIVYDKFLNAKTPAPLATSAPDPGYGVSAVGGYILSTNQQYFDTSSAYLTTTSPGALLGACSDARTVVITNAVMGGTCISTGTITAYAEVSVTTAATSSSVRWYVYHIDTTAPGYLKSAVVQVYVSSGNAYALISNIGFYKSPVTVLPTSSSALDTAFASPTGVNMAATCYGVQGLWGYITAPSL